jgi:hypothetical protein
MPKIVTERSTPGPCGACHRPLPTIEIWRGVIFGDFHELPTEVRTGTVNFLPCPSCGYQASLWPGFICVDERRNRVVFCRFDDDAESNDKLFADTVAYLRASDNAFETVGWTSPYVEVNDYRNIQAVLTHDDELFAMEAAFWRDFAARRRIKDLGARARLLFDQLRPPFAAMFVGVEASPSFKAALTLEAEARLADAEIDPMVKNAAKHWLHVAKLHSELALESPEHDTPRSEQLAFEELARQQAVSPSVFVPLELARRLEKLIDGARERLASTNLASSPHLLALHRLLQVKHISSIAPIDERADAARSIEPLQPVIKRLAQALGGTTFSDVDGTINSVESIAASAAAGFRRYQVAIHRAVTGSRAQNKIIDERGRLAAIEFFAEIAVTFGDLEAFMFAVFEIGDWEGRVATEDPVLTYGAYAAGLKALSDLLHGHGLMVEASSLTVFGVASQRLARYLGKIGLSYAAALSSGVAVSSFTAVGRTDGALTSRTDAAQYLFEASRLTKEVLDDLIDELRRRLETQPDDRDNTLTQLARTLILRARMQFESTQRRVFNAEIRGTSDYSSAIADEGRIVLEADLVVFGRRLPIGDETQTDAEPIAASTEPESRRAETVKGEKADDDEQKENREDGASGGGTVIFTTMVDREGRLPYVISAHIIAGWYQTLGEVIGIADDTGNGEMLVSAFSVLLGVVRVFDEPSWTLYFVSAIEAELSMRGIEASAPLRFQLIVAGLGSALASFRKAGGTPDPADPKLHHWRSRFEALVDGLNPATPAAWLEGISPIGMFVEIAELLEAIGRYEAAFAFFIEAAHLTLAADEIQVQHLYQAQRFQHIVMPIYRAARVMAKLGFDQSQPGWARDCIELAEYAKAHSQRLTEAFVQQPNNGLGTAEDRLKQILANLPVSVEDLRQICTERSVVLVYSLMHETALNDGFWLSALIKVSSSEVTCVRRTRFENIYEPFKRVEALFKTTQASAVGKTLCDVQSALEAGKSELDDALETLADALVPPDIVAEIVQNGIDRLYLAPEAYLYDVPWAALSVQTERGRIPLCEAANCGSLALDLLPCQAALSRRRRYGSLGKTEPDAGALLSLNAEWRNDLPPIYGVRDRLVRAITEAGTRLELKALREIVWARPDVTSLVTMLREHVLSVFFGHGEVSNDGVQLILQDGVVTEQIVDHAARLVPFANEVTLLMACSGISSVSGDFGREVAGIHMSMVRGGARTVVGSAMPMVPIVALKIVEVILPLLAAGMATDVALEAARAKVRASQGLEHPLFWGHIICFGNGDRPVLVDIVKGENR